MALSPRAFPAAGMQQVPSSFGSFRRSHRPSRWAVLCWVALSVVLQLDPCSAWRRHRAALPTDSCKGHVRASWLPGIAPATPPPQLFVQHELQLEKQSRLSVPLGFPSHSAECLSQHNYRSWYHICAKAASAAQDIWSQYLKTLKSCMSFQTLKDFRSFQLLSYICPSCSMQKGFLMFKFHSEDLGKCIFHAILTRKKQPSLKDKPRSVLSYLYINFKKKKKYSRRVPKCSELQHLHFRFQQQQEKRWLYVQY